MSDISNIILDNINRIQFDRFEKDFSFIVNGKVYQTNSFVASMLSPNVSKIFEENMSISYYEIESEFEGDFNQIIEYGELKPTNFEDKEKQYFVHIMKLLGNNDECCQFFKELQEDISYDNVMQRIKNKKVLGASLKDEIEFISSNFHDFLARYPNELYSLDIDTIEQIVSNEKLALSGEEELFDIILELYTKSKEYATLFSYVIFMNLPTTSIQKFKQNFDPNDINTAIWNSICLRLEQDISTESKERYKESHSEFLNQRYIPKTYQQNIIEHLSEEYHGNVHTQNIIHITYSSIANNYCKPETIIEENDGNYFGTSNEPNSWIQFDFKERKVLLDSYTLKTMNWIENCGHLKSWVLEGSNDGKYFKEIDRRENCDILNGKLKIATFKVSCSTPQRFIRLSQVGKNWNGTNYLWINQIEFSGFLYE